MHDWKSTPKRRSHSGYSSDIAILKFMGGFRAMIAEQIEVQAAVLQRGARVQGKPASTPSRSKRRAGGILLRFMALATNKSRAIDEYGGSLENRVTLEVTACASWHLVPLIVVRWSPIDFI